MRITRVVIAVLTAAGLSVAASLPAQAQTQTAPSVTSMVGTGPGTAAGAVTVDGHAKVTAIDAANRTLTLQRSNGKTVTIDAGKEMKNFDQIKVGDTVRARYTAALALELKKDAQATGHATEETVAAPAPAGAKAGAVVGRKVTVMTEVTAVDEPKKRVTVRGPAGNEWDLNVQDPEQLKNIKKGDHVLATYVEGLVISVHEAAPADAKK